MDSVVRTKDETQKELLLIYRASTEHSPQPMVALVGDTNIIRYANPTFCRLSGKEQSELIGKPYSEAIPEGQKNESLALFSRVLDSGVTETLSDQLHTHAKPDEVFWTYTAWAIVDELLHPSGVMVQVSDTTSALLSRQLSRLISEALLLSGVKHHEEASNCAEVVSGLRLSMRETDHRVKNNLQTVSALLALQTTANEMIPAQNIVQVRMLIQTLAAIHDLLVQGLKENPTNNSMSGNAVLEILIPMLKEVLGHDTINYSSDDIKLAGNHGMTLAILVNEIVCNSMKHGANKVELELKSKENLAHLIICDDGPGFPQDFDPLIAGNFGMELISTLSRHDLRGSVAFSNITEGGACVTVSFPIKQN